MSTIIGSARIDERGKLSGGQAGDQKQTKTSDYAGEVSMQTFYVHSKGWYIIRPKSAANANAIAAKMKAACGNKHIGYDQGNRLGVISKGISTTADTECDCSSLVRACVKEATGKDPGNFTTANEASMLEATGLFEAKKSYTSGTTLYTGDILVTKTKGHTAIVTDGAARKTGASYYPKYTGKSESIVDALASLGVDSSKANRKKIAAANGISGYEGTAAQNTKLLSLLKKGKLKKA